MIEYIITINNQSRQVLIKEVKPHHATVEVDGNEYEVVIERKFKHHMHALDIKPAQKKQASNEGESKTNPENSDLKFENFILSPLPGSILSILVRKGEKIVADQTVMKMESMKMENEIKASKHGTVNQILVKIGDAVSENTPLIEIES
jgi:biotin carboxyl carrier protein